MRDCENQHSLYVIRHFGVAFPRSQTSLTKVQRKSSGAQRPACFVVASSRLAYLELFATFVFSITIQPNKRQSSSVIDGQ